MGRAEGHQKIERNTEKQREKPETNSKEKKEKLATNAAKARDLHRGLVYSISSVYFLLVLAMFCTEFSLDNCISMRG